MSLVFFTQWIFLYYCAVFTGFEKLVTLNFLTFLTNIIRYLGLFIVFIFYSPSFTFFLFWHIFANTTQIILAKFLIKKKLDIKEIISFSIWLYLKKNKTYIKDLVAITGTMLLLTQMDKMILSKIISLEKFGYYCLATQVAMCVTLLIVPFLPVYFTQFCRLIQLKEENNLINLYHKSCYTVSLYIIPTSLTLMLFSKEILYFWTKDTQVCAQCSTLVVLLAGGNLLNGLMLMPYTLQMAYGFTRPLLQQNVAIILIFIPLQIIF